MHLTYFSETLHSASPQTNKKALIPLRIRAFPNFAFLRSGAYGTNTFYYHTCLLYTSNLSISILTVLVFSVHHIYITYSAPACTTCLFILNLSKNSHLCFAIVAESGCKGKRFYRNRQMFSKVFFERVFFSKLPYKAGRPSSPRPVSYTHLDVYKRQKEHCLHYSQTIWYYNKNRMSFFMAIHLQLSLIHILIHLSQHTHPLFYLSQSEYVPICHVLL